MSKQVHVRWFITEIRALERLYPVAPWDEILAALPRHSKQSIRGAAAKRRLKRRGVPRKRDKVAFAAPTYSA